MKRIIKATLLVLVVGLVVSLIIVRARVKPEAPVQPIAYSHWQHVTKEEGPQLECTFCHENADKGPHATIPNTATCMGCHESMETDKPEIQKLTSFHESKQQPPWVRVYWLEPEANAFFNHKPHVKAGVECITCHGQIGQMQRVGRAVNQTMGWCIDCHRQSQASVDCYICHR